MSERETVAIWVYIRMIMSPWYTTINHISIQIIN